MNTLTTTRRFNKGYSELEMAVFAVVGLVALYILSGFVFHQHRQPVVVKPAPAEAVEKH